MTIVTLDSDFHTQLALSGANKPSVIRLRIEGLKSEACARKIAQVCRRFQKELDEGATLSISAKSARCHLLPIYKP
jgi:predicted nuclease of predicted toxin-antitoxin system